MTLPLEFGEAAADFARLAIVTARDILNVIAAAAYTRGSNNRLL